MGLADLTQQERRALRDAYKGVQAVADSEGAGMSYEFLDEPPAGCRINFRSQDASGATIASDTWASQHVTTTEAITAWRDLRRQGVID